MAPRKAVVLLIALWTLFIAYGLHALMVYKGRPGTVGKTPATWPRNDLIAPSAGKPQLVMFCHPECPCTRASLGELESLMVQAGDKVDVAVLFYEPETKLKGWSQTPLVKSARSIPGVRVILDHEGALARRFGAETSGHTVLYAVNGRLLFSGGITGSRGHLGDNGGLESVVEMIRNQSSAPLTAKVFGCGLFDQCTTSQTVEKN